MRKILALILTPFVALGIVLGTAVPASAHNSNVLVSCASDANTFVQAYDENGGNSFRLNPCHSYGYNRADYVWIPSGQLAYHYYGSTFLGTVHGGKWLHISGNGWHTFYVYQHMWDH